MITLQDIFNTYGDEYLERFGKRMPQEHKKVIQAIRTCHTSRSGTVVYTCPDCKKRHILHGSCGNRHCPMCQHQKAEIWIKQQTEKLLPCDYFFVTVTVPQELRRVLRSNQRTGYDALFRSTQHALKKLASDPRFVGTSKIGILAVLHTWGNLLQYHPHLHMIIPAGGISSNTESWRPSRQDLFVHTKPLAIIIRAAFKDAMACAGLLPQIPEKVWHQKWVVQSQLAGNGENALRYLGRYVYRVAISNNRIKAVDHAARTVLFTYKDRASQGRWRTTSLDVMEFMRRFLQHVLPHGFMKIRHIGLINGNSSLSIEEVRVLINAYYGRLSENITASEKQTARRPSCSACGTGLVFIAFFPPLERRNTG